MTMNENINVTGTATFNATDAISGARNLLKEFRSLRDFARNMGTLSVTAKLSGNLGSDLRKALSDAGNRDFVVKARLGPGALDALRRELQGIANVNVSVLTSAQVQTTSQITQLRGLISELRALGGNRPSPNGGGSGAGGNGGLSASTSRMLGELEQLNNAYKRGSIGATEYGAKMSALQVALRASASGATQGTKEFKALDQALTRTSQGLKNLEAAKISQLRGELTAANAAFQSAAASATTMAQRTAAIGARNAEVQRITVALQGMAASGRLTAEQLTQVNTLLARAGAQGAALGGAAGGLRGFGSAAGNALQNVSGMIPGVGGLTSVLGPMNAGLTAVVTTLGLFAAGLSASFKSAATFQQAMVDIKALTSPTTAELEKLREAAMNLGQDLGVGATESARAMLELNKAGLAAGDVIGGGLTGALNLAGAAGISAAEGSKLAVTAMTAFGRTASELPQIADTFANFSNLTVLGAEDLGMALAAVGPVAKSAGLDLNDFAGYMATLAQGGFRNMSDAGTSLKTMLLSLQAPSETAAGAIEGIALQVYDATGAMRPMADILADLRVKLAGMTEQQRNQTLKDIFGTDGIRAATILYSASAEAIEKNTDAMAKAGEAARIAKERQESYAGQVKKMQAAWESFRIEVGEKLLPVATQLVEWLTKMAGTAGDAFNGIEQSVQFIPQLIDTLGQFNLALKIAGDPTVWGAIFESVKDLAQYLIPLQSQLKAVTAVLVGLGKLSGGFTDLAAAQAASTQASIDAGKAYRAQSKEVGDLADLQAKAVVALEQMNQAMNSGDAAGARRAREELQALQEQMRSLRATAAAMQVGGLEVSSQVVDPKKAKEAEEALKDQKAAVEALKQALADRKLNFRLEGLEGAERDIEAVRQAFAKLREEAAKPFGGNQKAGALAGTMAQLAVQESQEIARIKADAAKEARKKAAEDAKQAAADAKQATDAVAQFTRQAESARIAAMEDGAAKRKALRQQELEEATRNAQALADQYPKFRLQIEQALQTQITSMRQSWYQEDVKLAKDAEEKKTQEAKKAAEEQKRLAEEAARKTEEARKKAFELAQMPIADAGRLTQQLEREQQLTDSKTEQLDLQRQITAAKAGEVQAIQSVLDQAGTLKLTDEERQKLADDLSAKNFEVAQSMKSQADLGKEILQDAEDLAEARRKVAEALDAEARAGATTFTTLSADLTRATSAVNKAFGSLAAARGQDAVKKAVESVTEALGKQRQVLEAMRGEYEKQKGAVQGLRSALDGLAGSTGNEALLERAAENNRLAFDAARRELDRLSSSGTASASELQEAVSRVQQSYSGLTSSIEQLGAARDKQQLEEIDRQIESRKQLGLYTEDLERMRDQITRGRKDSTTAELLGISDDLKPSLLAAYDAADRAGSAVEQMGAELKTAETQAKSTAQTMRDELGSVFSELPDLAGRAGTDAVQQFLKGWQGGMTALKVPGISSPVPGGVAAAGSTSVIQNIYINGNQVSGDMPGVRELLVQLGEEALRECRQRGS